jgi:hypothetical protein
MQDTIFKPKYSSRLYLGFVFLIPLEAFALWSIFSISAKSAEMIFWAGFFGLMILLMPFVFIKQITFKGHSFSIEKYVLPPKTIDYSDVIDIGNTAIKTKHGSIAIRSMKNSEELTDLLKKLIVEGKISTYQIENKLVVQENLSRKAILPSGIIASVLWFAFLFFFPYEKSLFRDLSILLFWIPTYILVYRFMKSKAENQ